MKVRPGAGRGRFKTLILAFAISGLILAIPPADTIGPAHGAKRDVDTSWIEYPPAERGDEADVYHGAKVPDPYRWLEDEDSEETQEWLAAQDEIAEKFLSQLPKYSEAMTYLEENWIDGVIGIPVRKGENTFFWEPSEGQNHPVLYVRKGPASPPEVVFDLNKNDPDGSLSTLPEMSASPKGRYVAYEIHHAGADAAEIHFYDTKTNSRLSETIPESYSGVTAWLPDESGFFYTYLETASMTEMEPSRKPGIYRHTVGTPVSEDVLVYDRPWEGMFMAEARLSDDEEHLLITDMNIMGSRGAWAARPIDGGADTEVTWLTDQGQEYRFAFIGSKGSEVFLATDYEAMNWRIVAADIDNPGTANLREVVAESVEPISMYAGRNAGNVALHDGLLYVTYIQHNSHVIRVFDLRGHALGEIEPPFPGTVTGINAKRDDPILHVGLRSFFVPHSVYAYDTAAETLSPSKTVEVPDEFGDFEVKRVFYDSKDGTRIPMSIMKRSDTPIDGKAKVLLYGYGGWGIPWMPHFDNWYHAWLHWGGIYAIANLRGGGEYGEAWHRAGQFFNKQNVFDDFAAAAEYLVDEGYTTPSRITIRGGSNGGLLTAACYNQRPELFGAVISQVAAVDLLRMPDTPIGATLTMELGAPKQSKEMFEYLLGYSPLHNVRREGPHPPILHMVGENDPRCKPGHIYKYVAEMQRTGAPERLAVLRVIRGAGHGSARKGVQIQWAADELAFAWEMTE
jgi:prolyl oligopeptidase